MPGLDEDSLFVASEARELLRRFRELQPGDGRKKGKLVAREELILKAQAIDLLQRHRVPAPLVALLDAMLGDVQQDGEKMLLRGATEIAERLDPLKPWIPLAVEYEVQQGGAVTGADIVDHVVIPHLDEAGRRCGREHLLNEVREARRSAWYRGMVASRRVALLDAQKK